MATAGDVEKASVVERSHSSAAHAKAAGSYAAGGPPMPQPTYVQLPPPGEGLPVLPPGFHYEYAPPGGGAPPPQFFREEPPVAVVVREPPPFIVVDGVVMSAEAAAVVADDEARTRECTAFALAILGIFFVIPAALCVCFFANDPSPRVRRWACVASALCVVYLILAIVIAWRRAY